MKTILLSDLSNPRLARAVSRQIGGKATLFDRYSDICNHGANSGFPGFVYYYETVEFSRRNRPAILESLKDDSENQGIGVLELVFGFRCLNGDFSLDEIGAALYGRYNSDLDLIYNALAWYALEKVCFDLDCALS